MRLLTLACLIALAACSGASSDPDPIPTDDAPTPGPCGGPLVVYDDEIGPQGFIEYQAGALPLILGVPHGGALEPEVLPVVDDGLTGDGGSLQTALLVRQYLVEATGYAPHMVINRVRRNRLNLNKMRWEDEPNATAQAAIDAGALWDDSLTQARERVAADCGVGAFIDVHTKAGATDIGIGMGIRSSDLDGKDGALDRAEIWEASAVRSLAARVEDPVAAIRGPQSLGALLTGGDRVVIPSPDRPGPGDDLYFWSGRNVWTHGSVSDGTIDGYHLELHFAYINADEASRDETAHALALALSTWLETWYGLQPAGS